MEATMRELNQQTAKVIGAVERGETVTVTKDGRHVATILPPDLAEPRYQFRTDPMGDEIDDMPVISGGRRILDDLDSAMEGFGE
ncbi:MULTISPECIES: type II toxin-antitoxin system Phd/YefM family antitoxin [Kitasatospora]|uniref:type II toxin-antitoxin system Phd/YefM family antitoxin n=1 Tax=Kitasatospora TaxID=2063 RepID=UPI0005BD0513|nr:MULTISPECIES: type II toxin-antitoxin system prevent-host-death family antitoxin [Kitasatospora]MCX4753096.1 type II toxin-antitoxin system prevent-host-death family antitoxin [Kitasatospora purpeofusca]WSR32626.1 type II toxin-antitoxin system prevent-host-death family antitoxin [Kitasatospora purpeofusca]WSR40716.1 type II toxin-antitoxin system prevent-host-death family antitoxin [Kitasatospora purpeofusca]